MQVARIRHPIAWLVAAAIVVALVSASASAAEGTVADTPLAVPVRSHATKLPQEWSVDDVASWMNYTIGYPEYTAFVLKHRVDGPTLLQITPSEFEEHFPISNGIHLVKLRAHLDILRGKCVCAKGAVDFWSYIETRRDLVLTRGSGVFFLPRVTLAYTYFFDSATFTEVLGHVDEDAEGGNGAPTVSGLSTALFVLGSVLAPYLYIFVQLARFWTTNYVVVTLLLVHALVDQYNELVNVNRAYRELRAGQPVLQVLRTYALHYSMAIPIISWALSFVLPYVVQQVLVLVFLGHGLFVLVGTVVMIIHVFAKPRGEEQEKND